MRILPPKAAWPLFTLTATDISTIPISCAVSGTTHRTGRYILQRINSRVFTNIAALMANVERITAYLREKIAEQGGDPARECLTLIPTKDGRSYCLDGQGSGWRMLLFVEKTVSLETADTPESFAHSGVAFGRFQRLLADFPAADTVRNHSALS